MNVEYCMFRLMVILLVFLSGCVYLYVMLGHHLHLRLIYVPSGSLTTDCISLTSLTTDILYTLDPLAFCLLICYND